MDEEDLYEKELYEKRHENFPPRKKEKTMLLKHVLYGCVIFILFACVALGAGLVGGFLAYMDFGNKQTTVIYESSQPPLIESGSIPDVLKRVQDSVVLIETEYVSNSPFMWQYVSKGGGSGVILTKNGYIVTNSHVVDGAEHIEVTLRDKKKYVAALISSDPTTDIAVIRIHPEQSDLTTAVIGDSDKIVVGEDVIAIGNPFGEGGTVTNGIVSALEKQITIDGQNMTLIQTNAAINPGNSGGGLFNMRGELIGVVNAKTWGKGIEGIGFSIPSNTVKKIVDDMIRIGYVTGRTMLGIEIADITDFREMFHFGVSSEGVYISKIVKDSDADKAGLLVKDKIIGIDNTEIKRASDVKTFISRKNPGDTVTLHIIRNEELKQIQVRLTEYVPISE